MCEKHKIGDETCVVDFPPPHWGDFCAELSGDRDDNDDIESDDPEADRKCEIYPKGREEFPMEPARDKRFGK